MSALALPWLVILAFATALLAARLLARAAPRLGLLDHPGGRKDHGHATPLVGGLAVYAAMLLAAPFLDGGKIYLAVLAAASLVVIAGVADDRFEIGPLPRFVLEACAALVMAFGAGVVLESVGRLVGFRAIDFGWLAIPMTVFCVLGVINSINMMDGADGLAGSVSAVAFAAYAYVAFESGLEAQGRVLLVLLGGVLGFLVLNMRFPGQPRARIFLGDTGSMLLGLMIAWFAVDLTNGPGRRFPPICALWVVVIPLCDCVSLMARRRKAGRSAMAADREHLHHFLRGRGLSIPQTQAVIALASAAGAGFAVAGWKLGVPEPVFFAVFVTLFIGYHGFMGRAFRDRAAVAA